MKHVTGTIKEKKSLLNRLTPDTFPYLVADILSYVFKHKKVRVVDGPGDGRRDIYSVFPDGKEGITQCKYHKSVKNVGSRETDEIVISLNKFGYYNGIFATTGGVSPQAKREYLDNYKNFNLELWDADSIVNYTLSSPILKSYWLDGESIVKATSEIAIPFTLRSISSDMPIIEEVKDILEDHRDLFSFEVALGDQTLFYPYRVPRLSNSYETGSLQLTCWKAKISGGIYQVERIRAELINTLKKLLSQNQPLQVRLGYACIVNGDDFIGATKILSYKPETYVFNSDNLLEEREYVLPQHSEWVFPENLSVLEAPWACWLNKSFESALLISTSENRLDKPTPFELSKFKWDKTNYDMSLYIGGEISKVKKFLNEIGNESQPDNLVDFGYGGAIMFWKHPNIIAEEKFGLNYKIDKKGEIIPSNTIVDDNKKFNSFKDKLLKKAKKNGLSKSCFAEFESAVKLKTQKNILEISSQRSFGTAELFHDFENCSSPIDLTSQKITIIRFYSTHCSLVEAKESLEDISSNLNNKYDLSLSVKMSKEIGIPFILLEYSANKPIEKSVDDFLTNDFNSILGELIDIESAIKSRIQDADVDTVRFLRDSVGFRITDDEFCGSPWMIMNGKKMTWDEYEATL